MLSDRTDFTPREGFIQVIAAWQKHTWGPESCRETSGSSVLLLSKWQEHKLVKQGPQGLHQ